MKTTLTVYIDAVLIQRLKEDKEEQGLSVSFLVNRILREKFYAH